MISSYQPRQGRVTLFPARRATRRNFALGVIVVIALLGLSVFAQVPPLKVATAGSGKDFKFPDYYPASNGVRQLKTLVTGSEAQFVSNNMNLVRLQEPRLTNYSQDGKVEWSAQSEDCIVNVATREVRGSSNLLFQTADGKLFLTGRGFLWQSNNSVLILSNQVYTRIDKSTFTNDASLRHP